jgi:hypothetical protein
MNAPQPKAAGHSADVRIHLLVNGCVLPVAKLGPEYLELRSPADCAPCEADITLSIDGHETRWTVYLPSGIQSDCRKTVISSRNSKQ